MFQVVIPVSFPVTHIKMGGCFFNRRVTAFKTSALYNNIDNSLDELFQKLVTFYFCNRPAK